MPKTKAKDPAAVALGRKGGKARVVKMTAKERTEAASNAANERWRRYREEQAAKGANKPRKGRS